jgi:hypothetical protein
VDEKTQQELLTKLYFMVKKIDERLEYLESSMDLLVRIQTQLLSNKNKYPNSHS